jgi:tRNA modification GTPase
MTPEGTASAARTPRPRDENDTIAAIASPPGPAARGIVRLSGPKAHSIALDGFSPAPSGQPLSRRFARICAGTLKVKSLRPHLKVMTALWHGPRSYTGEDVAEIHLIGSAPLLGLVLSHSLSQGARAAEPGEFTLRAFLSGRVDLTRAEAVLGVLNARNPAQLDAALEQLAGGISGPITAIRDRLLDRVAHLEANLDFTEEPDVDPVSRASLAQELDEAALALSRISRQLSERERAPGENRVVLVGPPNAGKSRLYNAILGRDRAIVSPAAGTTRDYLCEHCDCDGLPVLLVDTAGFDEPEGAIATQAQSLRAQQAARADLLLECCSVEAAPAFIRPAAPAAQRLHVWTKADLLAPEALAQAERAGIVTSAITGAGLLALRSAIARAILERQAGDNPLSGTGARCRGSLSRASAALRSAARIILEQGGDELVAFDLRLAVDELGSVVGAVVTDDILDRIFRRFCIGK